MIDLKAQAELEIGEDSDKDKKANEAARREWNTPRILRIPFTIPSNATSTQIGDGPQQRRQWQIRRIAMDSLSGTVNAAPVVDGQQNTFFNSGTVTDPGTNATLSSLNVGTGYAGAYWNVTVTIGYGSAAGTVANNFQFKTNTLAVATHMFTPLTAYTQSTYYFPNVSNNTEFYVQTETSDSSGVYLAAITATFAGYGAMYFYSDASLSSNSLVWVMPNTPDSVKISRDELTLRYPEKLFVAQSSTEIPGTTTFSAMGGSVQVLDMPDYSEIYDR